jgi:glycine/D-amino acid oxidase-like deaminating enzyme
MTSPDGPMSAGGTVAVIGGGIVGSYVAYELARTGCTVEVLDPASGPSASVGNAGILALSYAKPMSNPQALVAGARSVLGLSHDVELARPIRGRTLGWMTRFVVESRPFRAQRAASAVAEMARHSVVLYDELADRESVDLGFRRTGWLYVARDAAALRAQQSLAESMTSVGVRSQVVRGAELYDLEPELRPGLAGGVFYPDDISMDPRRVTAAVAEAAQRSGAHYAPERVVSAELDRGRVLSLRTESGRTVHAQNFVIATGAHSAEVGRMLGVRLPVEPAYGYSLVIPTSGRIARRALMNLDDHVVVNPGDESVRITGGMQFGGSSEVTPTEDQIAGLRTSAEAMLPALREVQADGIAWRGARPMTPSGLPIVNRFGVNVVAVTGHGTLGMTLAPDSAQRACSLIAG